MKISFCIPGKEFTGRFLECWTNLIEYLNANNIDFALCRRYHPNIYRVRQECLRVAKQFKPDYYMWIHSDIIFKPKDFEFLLENRNKGIVSGLYLQPEGASINDIPIYYACFTEGQNRLLTSQMFSQKELFKVRANGMGWMLVDKNIFEKIEAPFDQTSSGVSEDVMFQDKASKLGFNSWVDPRIRLGHEKSVILN